MHNSFLGVSKIKAQKYNLTFLALPNYDMAM